jgi:TPR repeat protein
MLVLLAGITFTIVAAAESGVAEQLFRFHYEAAKRDNPESMYILANMYESGRGIKRNYDEAIKWYSKAAKFGNSRAATKMQEAMRKKALAALEEAKRVRKKRAQNVQLEAKIQQRLQKAQSLEQQLGVKRHAVEKAKADAERATMLLQQQIDVVKSETEKARDEAEKIRGQQEQLAREKAQLEQLRQSLLEKEKQLRVTTEKANTETEIQHQSKSKAFKADPCDGPSARFMSTCR